MNEQIQGISSTAETEFRVMTRQAEMLVKTGFLPKAIDTAEKAVAIILTGKELGIPTMCALRSIDVIQGKPTVSPQLMMALINRSKELENIEIKLETKDGAVIGVTVSMKRKGRSVHRETFSRTDAQNLGLLTKDNWRKQPAVMLKWRAVAACARIVFPDVVLGLYLPEEMGDTMGGEDLSTMALPDLQTETIRGLSDSPAFPTESQTAFAGGDETGVMSPETTIDEQLYNVCQELNRSGDSIIWTKKQMAEYASGLFDHDPSLADAFLLPDDDKYLLLEDLSERLNERKTFSQ